MNPYCHLFVHYILHEAPTGQKATVVTATCERFLLTKDRSVYHNQHFAVRFCYTKGKAFGNTVLSLSHLEKYDRIPFFVVLVRRSEGNAVWMANSTLLKKVSHSSRELAMDNIKGSFNGADIIKNYNGIANEPSNFDTLFALHEGLSWEDNLQRLVEATACIKPQSTKFTPSPSETAHIHQAWKRAVAFVQSADYTTLLADLNERCKRCESEITIASHIENVDIRGRLIEALVTASDEERAALLEAMRHAEEQLPLYDTRNGLGDYIRTFDKGKAYTDIKTKVIYLSSNPKAYNIDKFLECMAEGDSVFLFFFIGIDERGLFCTRLCSAFHRSLVDATILQYHWAGRSTRGTAQLNGKAIDDILKDKNFTNAIEQQKTNDYLDGLLAR